MLTLGVFIYLFFLVSFSLPLLDDFVFSLSPYFFLCRFSFLFFYLCFFLPHYFFFFHNIFLSFHFFLFLSPLIPFSLFLFSFFLPFFCLLTSSISMSLSSSSFPSFSCRGRVPFFFLRWFSFHASRNRKKKKKCNKCTCFFLAVSLSKTGEPNVGELQVKMYYYLLVCLTRCVASSWKCCVTGCCLPPSHQEILGVCGALLFLSFCFCFVLFILFCLYFFSLFVFLVQRSRRSLFFLFYHPLPSVDFVPFRLFVMSFKCFVFFLLSFFPSFLSSFLVLPYFLFSYHYENRVH